jgi:hypothetical protein
MSNGLQAQIDELKRELAKKDNEITGLKRDIERLRVHEARPLRMKLSKAMNSKMRKYDLKLDHKLRSEKINQTISYIQDRLKKTSLQNVKEDANIEEPIPKKTSREIYDIIKRKKAISQEEEKKREEKKKIIKKHNIETTGVMVIPEDEEEETINYLIEQDIQEDAVEEEAPVLRQPTKEKEIKEITEHYLGISIEKEKLLAEEQQELADRFDDAEDPITRYNCILLKEPDNVEKFKACLDADREHHDNNPLFIDDNGTYVNYWNNMIKEVEDIRKTLINIFTLERGKGRNIEKVSTSFGIIIETPRKTKLGSDPIVETLEYVVFSPNQTTGLNDEIGKHNLYLVNMNEDNSIEEYIQNVIYNLRKINESTKLFENSDTRYIAIHKIQVNCFYLLDVGKKTDSIIHNLSSNHNVFQYDGEYNICWFAIPVFYKHYEIDKKETAINKKELVKLTKESYKRFYKINGGSGSKPPLLGNGTDIVRNSLKKYKGFQPLTEIDRFIEEFNLPSITVWGYDEKSNINNGYHRETVYKCKKHKDDGENYKGKYLNISVIPVVDPVSKGPLLHALYIKDYEELLDIHVCPKCKFAVFQMNRHNDKNNNPHYYEHVKKCTGKRPDKRLIVPKVELPFCPGMMNNQEFLYLKANNMMHKWKPTKYFITYDLETVETLLPADPNSNESEAGERSSH